MRNHGVPPWIVAIGASGGQGLDDIRSVLQELPASLDAIVLVVLHRPWDQISHLAAVLGRATQMPVRIAEDGEFFRPGHVYVGGPADHLTLAAKSFGLLIHDPTKEHRNRTVDLLFRSVAEYGGRHIVGVVLSGALDDGSRGLAAIHRAGGTTMVLTPVTPSGDGMPANAIAFDGPIDLIGSPSQIATEISRMVAGEQVGSQ